MAWPIREQFALATLALLVPVTLVLVYGASSTYSTQVAGLEADADRMAETVAATVDVTGGDVQALQAFLDRFPLHSPLEAVIVTDANGEIAAVRGADFREGREMRSGSNQPATRPWTVTAYVPLATARDQAAVIFSQVLLVSGLATLLVFLLEVFFVRRFLRSFARLERVADRVGSGDLTILPRAPMPTRELEHVHQAFRGMVDNLRNAREAIAKQVEEERRMRREVEMLQQQIIRQERLAAIGLLLSGIAHELNNPLQAISGFAELLQRDQDVRPDVRADLALIQKESARASGIIRNLSRFSRQQHTAPGPVLLTHVIAAVVELRQRRLQEQGIELQLDERASKPVTAVLTELQQVVLNFVVNAEQAVIAHKPEIRRIVIRTSDTPDGVLLEVEDSGPGVAPEHESKLFQPFFTTKPVGEGTGLGLSVSYGIVRSFGGLIGYNRSPMGGARFYFELPSPAQVRAAS